MANGCLGRRTSITNWRRRRGEFAWAGSNAVHQLAEKVGLIDAIDRHVHVLKIHLPYHESDHVLNLAYNAPV